MSTLVHTHRDVWWSGLFQEVQFAYHTMIVELWSHILTICVLVEEIGWYCRRFVGVGPTVEVKVLHDGIDQLQLHKLYGSVAEFLNLDTEEVTDVSLIINGEVVRACSQVRDDGIDRVSVGTEDDAVVNVDKEYDRPAVVKTWVKSTGLETNFLHALVHVFVPYTTCLLLPVHVAHQLEGVWFS